jgi:hypothetical protein
MRGGKGEKAKREKGEKGEKARGEEGAKRIGPHPSWRFLLVWWEKMIKLIEDDGIVRFLPRFAFPLFPFSPSYLVPCSSRKSL